MNLHEYQGKELLKSYGVQIQEGILALNAAQAADAAKKLKELYILYVLPASLHLDVELWKIIVGHRFV